MSQLQLAGWSTDSDSELGLKHVDEIRIGWGGYVGIEGQRVEFSLTLPEIGAVSQAADRRTNTRNIKHPQTGKPLALAVKVHVYLRDQYSVATGQRFTFQRAAT